VGYCVRYNHTCAKSSHKQHRWFEAADLSVLRKSLSHRLEHDRTDRFADPDTEVFLLFLWSSINIAVVTNSSGWRTRSSAKPVASAAMVSPDRTVSLVTVNQHYARGVNCPDNTRGVSTNTSRPGPKWGRNCLAADAAYTHHNSFSFKVSARFEAYVPLIFG
jgi:hypothetical protein